MLKLFNEIVISIKKNKTKFFSLIILGFFLLLMPVQSVRADFWSDLGDIIQGILNLPINIALIIGVVIMLIPLIMNAIGCFFIYVITVVVARMMILYALSIPISPSSPEAISRIGIIYNAWNFTLGFVNMFFALTLTFIGLATILGLKNYEAKKLLPKLLIIAILVNFTPVIIGFIVDMGNLVTNFFVSKAGIDTDNASDFLGSLWDVFETALSLKKIGDFFASLGGLLFSSFTIILGKAIELCGGIIIGIVFLLYSAYIYICVITMFFLRTIMLWILTILSPIAFFSYIFPESSPFQKLFPGILSWKEWWDEFLKWVVVGIPFGLFLYVSTAIFKLGGIDTPTPVGVGKEFLGMDFDALLTSITTLFTYTVSIMMLHQGYKISMKAAPEMARAMIENSQKFVKTAAMAAATMGVGAVAGAAAGSVGSMASGLGSFSAKAASGGVGKRILGKGAGGLSKVMRRGQTRLTQTAMENKPKLLDKFGDMKAGAQLDATKGIFNKRSRMEHYKEIDWNKVPEKDREKMIPEIEKMMENENLKSEYGDTFKKMSKAGISSAKIRTGLSDNSEEAEKEIGDKAEEIKDNMSKNEKLEKEIEIKIKYVEDTGGNREQFMKDLAAQALNFEELKPGDLKNLGKDNITSLSARLGSHKLSGNSLKSIRDNYREATASKLFNEAGGIGDTDLETLYRKNPKLVRHLTVNEYGKTWEWEAGLQFDKKKYKTGGKADWSKIKKQLAKEYSEDPKEDHIADEEIISDQKKEQLEEIKRKGRRFGTRRIATGIKQHKVGRLARKKERIGKKDTPQKIMTSFLYGALDKKRVKIMEKRIQRIQRRMDKKIIKHGSEEQKNATAMLNWNKELNDKIQNLKNLYLSIQTKKQEIQKLQKLINEENNLTQKQMYEDSKIVIEEEIKDLRNEYIPKEKTIKEERKKLEEEIGKIA